MLSVFRNINIVIVANEEIDIDGLNRADIKTILKDSYDESPKYIEIPEQAAVFDYLTNPDFPIQLNLQGNRIVFILSGNAGYDPADGEHLTHFVNRFKTILELETFSDVISNIKAVGLNAFVSVTSEESEEAFNTTISSALNGILSEEGSFHAGGIHLARIDGNRRLEINLKPVIPEMGEAFTHSYNLQVNLHFQPAAVNWLDALNSDVHEFKAKVEEIITTLNSQT